MPIRSSFGDSSLPVSDSPTEFHPYIPAETMIPEFTARGVILGTLLGMVFGASSSAKAV